MADSPGVFVPRGAGSCAAAACHGSAMPVGPEISNALRNEHTTWITADPHAMAYDALLSERSKRIATNLGKRSGKVTSADQDGRCLACHATPSADSAGPVGSDIVDSIRRDGVGCESCHGPAGGWLSAHTAVDWSRMDKATLGFRDLKDLGTRAETCSGCHVGAPADPAHNLPSRDVNHDLIAAGHPRLNWEFAAYSANAARHWRAIPNDRDARLWKVGQVASMRSALDLLDERAAKAVAKTGPWPEFAESGCFSCHFSLKDKSLRGDSRDPFVKLGTPAWGSWHVPMLKALVDANDPGMPRGTKRNLEALREAMKPFSTDPAAVRAPAKALRDDLDKWLRSTAAPRLIDSPLDPTEIQALLKTLNEPRKGAPGSLQAVTGWDSAAQLFLALASLYRTQEQLTPPASPDLKAQLGTMRDALKFKDGLDSPGGFDPAKIK